MEHLVRVLKVFAGVNMRRDAASTLPLELAVVESATEPEPVVAAAAPPAYAPPQQVSPPQAAPARNQPPSRPPAPQPTYRQPPRQAYRQSEAGSAARGVGSERGAGRSTRVGRRPAGRTCGKACPPVEYDRQRSEIRGDTTEVGRDASQRKRARSFGSYYNTQVSFPLER